MWHHNMDDFILDYDILFNENIELKKELDELYEPGNIGALHSEQEFYEH